MKKYTSFKEFYAFYLTEHQNTNSRRLHFVGTSLVFLSLWAGILTGNYQFFWAMPVLGYGFAWVGHFFFEKNKPATFQHPFYSLASDFKLFFDICVGKEKL